MNSSQNGRSGVNTTVVGLEASELHGNIFQRYLLYVYTTFPNFGVKIFLIKKSYNIKVRRGNLVLSAAKMDNNFY